MQTLSQMKNIGEKLTSQLVRVGIDDAQKLRETGAKEAWLKIRAIDSSACYNRLCALQGAIQDVRWHDLELSIKEDLKTFYNNDK